MDKVYVFVIQKEANEEATEVFVRTFAKEEKAKEAMVEAITLEIVESDCEFKDAGAIEELDFTLYDDNGGATIFSITETEIE